MSEKNVLARRRYWSSMTQEQRSARMSAIAKIRQGKLSPAARRAHAMLMVSMKKIKNSA